MKTGRKTNRLKKKWMRMKRCIFWTAKFMSLKNRHIHN